MPSCLCAKGNFATASHDPFRPKTVPMSTLWKEFHTTGGAEGAHAKTSEIGSKRHTVTSLSTLSQSILPCVWFKQTFGHAHRKNIQMYRMRKIIHRQKLVIKTQSYPCAQKNSHKLKFLIVGRYVILCPFKYIQYHSHYLDLFYMIVCRIIFLIHYILFTVSKTLFCTFTFQKHTYIS